MTKKIPKNMLRKSNAFKLLMVLLYLLSTLGITGGFLFTIEFYDGGLYHENPDRLSQSRIENMCQSQIMELNSHYWQMCDKGYHNTSLSESYRQQLYDDFMNLYTPENSNFEFIIADAQENLLFQSFTDGHYQYSHTEPFFETSNEILLDTRMRADEWEAYQNTHSFPAEAQYDVEEIWISEPVETSPHENSEYAGVPEDTAEGSTEILQEIPPVYYEPVYEDVLYYDVTVTMHKSTLTHYITGFVRSELNADDYYAKYERFMNIAYDYRYVPIVVMAVSVVVFLVSLSFLIYAAGYRKDQEEPTESLIDRIPYDLFSLITLLAGMAVIIFADDVANSVGSILQIGLICAGIMIIALIVLLWLVSTAVRFRTKHILTNTILVRVCRIILRMTEQGAKSVQNLPVLWQIPLAALGFFLLNILCMWMAVSGNEFGLVLMILLYTAAILLTCVVVAGMHLLEQGAEKISGGDLEYKIPLDKLFGPFKKHGQHLNSIGEGMNRAVSERIKSEMFKTELIANVSHDIRTPLTSIINYTDLLSKLNLEDAQAQEYLEVLTRQSARLRKLTEDVLEASKATTGSLNVQKEKMDLRVLLEQIQGEYAEKLEAKSLQMVCTIPETPLYISADGRLLWRVMDNLFSNVCKYAMPGTRVYLDTLAEDGKVILTLRNISAVQLHISADMLMERFVQGDRSRNTEGSGLGLSIAQSLTSLQGGRMELSIDGDLFKVKLTFSETVF